MKQKNILFEKFQNGQPEYKGWSTYILVECYCTCILREFKIFFQPAKFDNFKDEKISDFKTVSVSQRKNLLD